MQPPKIPMCHIYCTDYGDVRISEIEARRIQLANDIGAYGLDRGHFAGLIAKASAIEDACRKVALWKAAHGR